MFWNLGLSLVCPAGVGQWLGCNFFSLPAGTRPSFLISSAVRKLLRWLRCSQTFTGGSITRTLSRGLPMAWGRWTFRGPRCFRATGIHCSAPKTPPPRPPQGLLCESLECRPYTWGGGYLPYGLVVGPLVGNTPKDRSLTAEWLDCHLAVPGALELSTGRSQARD